MWGALATGVMSATNIYVVSLDLPDDQLVGLTLAAPAGEPAASPDGARPPGVKDEPLSAELLAELRASEVRNVRVKEFRCGRWRGRWWFGLSLVGLLIGAVLTRVGGRPQRAADAPTDAPDNPAQVLDTLIREVKGLRGELPKIGGRDAQLDAIVQRVGQLQKTHLVALVDARELLVARLGLAGYAVLMDHFAAAERQLNRAWSAAVDRAWEEAVACLDEAAALLKATREGLPPPTAE
jgi:hypothetical protein